GGIEVDHLQFSFGAACAATPDLNGDGHVNATDLATLLGSWGPCPAGCCAADFNYDGVVSAADLATLLGAWTGYGLFDGSPGFERGRRRRAASPSARRIPADTRSPRLLARRRRPHSRADGDPSNRP